MRKIQKCPSSPISYTTHVKCPVILMCPSIVINLKPSTHHLPRLALLFAGGVIFVYLMCEIKMLLLLFTELRSNLNSARVYFWHAETGQNSTGLKITISLFYVAAKHPEEVSNAETSVYLYRH